MKHSERLQKLIEYLNTSQSGLARSLKTSHTKIGFVLKGRNNISKALAMDIVRVYNYVSYKWLMTGEGEMIIDPSEQNIVSEPLPEYNSQIASLNDRIKQLEKDIEQKDKYINTLEELNAMLKNQIADLKKEPVKKQTL